MITCTRRVASPFEFRVVCLPHKTTPSAQSTVTHTHTRTDGRQSPRIVSRSTFDIFRKTVLNFITVIARYFLHLTAQTRVTLRSLEEMDLSFSRAAAIRLVHDALFLSIPDQVKQFVRDLPILPKDQIPLEDSCLICFVPFLEILESMEDVTDEEGDERGITKLEGCGHIFCRKE